MTDNPVLSTKNMAIGYGRGSGINRVLADLDLEANEGQLIAVIGANGTGKSTLLKSLAGLLPLLEGRIRLNGCETYKLKPSKLATLISIVLTERIQPGYLTVGDLVAMGRHPYTDWQGRLQKQDLDACLKALQITGLSHMQRQKLHTLSDGQLQKAMIARALAQDGALLLLDEPLIHLDISSKWEIMGILKRMTLDRSKTVILATHELELSLEMADRIWLINKTRQLITGTPEDMVQNGVISETFDTEHYKFRKGDW